MSRIRPLLAAAAAGVFFSLLAFASPAYAHDELVGSNPVLGESLPAAPTEITLDFSADVMTVGAAVIVADGQGRDWVTGEPAINLGQVTVTVDPEMPVAGYEIRWRVVSSDGHPISGLIPFTIGDAEPLTRTAAATPGSETAADAGSEESAQGTQETNSAIRIALTGAGGAAAAAVIFSAIHFIRRRFTRRDGGDPHDTADVAESTHS